MDLFRPMLDAPSSLEWAQLSTSMPGVCHRRSGGSNDRASNGPSGSASSLVVYGESTYRPSPLHVADLFNRSRLLDEFGTKTSPRS
jgi:hypothetical protein